MATQAPSCNTCTHRCETTLFELCHHGASLYSIAGKEDYHTIGHMRDRGGCGPDARLHTPLKTKR